VRASGSSLTARWVAAQRARLSDHRPASPDGDADAEARLYRTFSRVFLLPGLTPTGMATRTTFFDHETKAAIDHGTPQIVIVGAGYDGRALRFRTPGVHWFEVDHPATQPDKKRRLAALGVAIDHVSFVAVDLTANDLDGALQSAGHEADVPTLFICEGLFAYLPIEAAAQVCKTLRRRAHPRSTLAANFRVAPPTGNLRYSLRAVVDAVLAVIGERRLNDFRPGDAESLIEGAGWRVVKRDASKANRLDGGTHLLVIAAEPAA
jgi:methyltransferase (TIGR00027 family)